MGENMTFAQAVSSASYYNYFNFNGRAPRSEFWWFQVYMAIVYIILGIVFTLGGGIDWMLALFQSLHTGQVTGIYAIPHTGFWMDFAVILATVSSLFFFIPQISVTVRRFHDLNLSAWWVVGLWGAAVVCTSILWLPLVAVICAIARFIICVVGGTTGPNNYGPDPLA